MGSPLGPGTPVVDDYQAPFPFTGRIGKLTAKIRPPEEREMICGRRQVAQQTRPRPYAADGRGGE